ncbi:hypothetical protein [Oceanicella actignis]|uniref:Uncharacterized protein n=1 Tax=Oceanicella actignis TaxID=1189325 RepID=A0A1M7S8F9_9RHOB|nr:hypothetical protein [Oceanicella actignis]TYO91661.1 hypothetical protein LY05_00518 [Oceanicella actignis]SET32868.1 hypothetical protein SAMN04488119_103480 [Oceanicella actignis]SHN54675.1 hypothetical protein SAMN05216200_10228 [Oceanicella actignis]
MSPNDPVRAPMTLAQFEDLALRHGPDLDDWPAAARPGALALLEASAEARAVQAGAAALWRALDALAAEAEAPSPGLSARILAAAEAQAGAAPPEAARPPRPPAAEARRGRAGARRLLGAARRALTGAAGAGAAMAASLMLGAWLGYAALPAGANMAALSTAFPAAAGLETDAGADLLSQPLFAEIDAELEQDAR